MAQTVTPQRRSRPACRITGHAGGIRAIEAQRTRARRARTGRGAPGRPWGRGDMSGEARGAQELVGLQVLTIAEGKRLGTISRLLVRREERSVAAVGIGGGA